MNKDISYNIEARDKLKKGIDKLADAVKVTLGPKGRHVVIESPYGSPHATKDGVSVAQEIYLKDPIENMGAQMVKEASTNVAKLAGDGTSTVTVFPTFVVVTPAPVKSILFTSEVFTTPSSLIAICFDIFI